ncbi:hypothetical protein RHCRD62_40149 [Rhodococcus sp. RD6.2]|nr:hypothetical protein RHCRD62_40149 [Rhodococcus sp. RD6.2]
MMNAIAYLSVTSRWFEDMARGGGYRHAEISATGGGHETRARRVPWRDRGDRRRRRHREREVAVGREAADRPGPGGTGAAATREHRPPRHRTAARVAGRRHGR